MDYLDYEKDICTNEKFRDKSNENKIIRLDNIFLNIKNTLNILFKKKYYSKIIDYEFDHPHTKIIKIKNKLPKKLYEEYLKFSVIRNPISTFVSACNERYSRKKYNFFNGSKLNLNQKVFMYAEIFFKQNNVYLDEENQCDIDYLIRYENLYDDLNILLDKLGLEKKKDIRNIVLNSSKFNNNMDENKQLHTIREMNTDSFNHILKVSDYYERLYYQFGYEKFYGKELKVLKNLIS